MSGSAVAAVELCALPGGATDAAAPVATSQSAGSGRVLRQGAVLFLGYAAAQGLAFGRNAILGRMLSPTDFGVAAALTVMLHGIETISDLAVDRMILQADDSGDRRLLAAGHALSLLRGLAIALLLLALAPAAASVFSIDGGALLFMGLALVPLIKSLMHLDQRLRQRQLDNRPAVAIEIAPQLATVAAAVPLIWWLPGPEVALVLAWIQAIAAVAVSHAIARTPYRVGFDRIIIRRFLSFGWPIMLSALPVLVVYQGDRMIVGAFLGVEPLAKYTTAFLIALVPGALAAKAALSIMLPLLASVGKDRAALASRFALMSEVMVLIAGFYLVGLTFLGGHLVAIAFGPAYAGAGVLTAALALMWSLRMIQSPAGALLMAIGNTKPLFVASLIRACSLALTLMVAWAGGDVVLLAVSGAFGEFLSLGYVGWKMSKIDQRFGNVVASRSAMLASAALLMSAAMYWRLIDQPLHLAAAAVALLLPALAIAAGLIMPGLRSELRQFINHRLHTA